MKIKAITIHNIASIEHAEIDFTRQPLADEPLFLISGETGTGKTTILNAICLALYNTAPNINNGERQEKDIEKVAINDPRQLMRRGTTSAQVTLRVEGNDGDDYTAIWNVQRARNKITGGLQQVKRSLLCEKKGISLEKVADIKELIEGKVVGLDYEQFCRTTMLAQGEFSKFMNSKSDEKARILEKLTGTEIFATIGQAIFSHFKTAKDEFNALDNQIKGAQLLTKEERNEKQMQIELLGAQLTAKRKQVEATQQKCDWLTQWNTLNENIAKEKEHKAQLEAQLKSGEMLQKMATATLWDATADIRHRMQTAQKNADDLKQERQRMAEKQDEYNRFVAGRNFLQAEQQRISSEIARLEAALAKEQSNGTMYENIQRIESLLDTINAKEASISKNSRALTTCENEKKQQEAPLQKATSEANNALQTLTDKTNIVREKSEATRGFNLNEAIAKRDAAKAKVEQVSNCMKSVADYRTKVTELKEKELQFETIAQALNKAEKQKADGQALLPDAEKRAESLYNQLKGKTDLRNQIVLLRQRFSETKTCPLCGSKVDGLHTDAILDTAVTQAKQSADEAESRVRQLKETIQAAETNSKTYSTQLTHTGKQLAKARSDKAKAEWDTAMQLNAIGIELANAQLDDAIKQQAAHYQQALNAADQLVSTVQAKMNALETARQEESEARKIKETADETLKDLKDKIADYDKQINQLQTLITNNQKDKAAAQNALVPLLTFAIDWSQCDCQALKTQLTNAATRYKQDLSNREKRQQEQLQNATRLETVDNMLQELASTFTKVPSDVGCKAYANIENRLQMFNNKVATLRGSIQKSEANLLADNRLIDQFFAENHTIRREAVEQIMTLGEATINLYKQEKRSIDADIQKRYGSILQLQKQLSEHNERAPHLEAGENTNNLQQTLHAQQQEVEEINKAKIGLETSLKDDSERAKAVAEQRKALERIREIRNNWEILNNDFGGKDGLQFKRIAQSYVLRQLLQKANYYLRMLNHRYELACYNGSLAINVIDHHQGDAQRNVDLLSGGESFIVSLALALGLSAINKEKINVDTLFIDEGFGTLSSEHLETVIDALNKLHSFGGRRVGIISHVEELARRIPTQIKLSHTGLSSSKVEVVTL